MFSWAQHVCHAIGIMMCSIQPSLRTCSVNWFVCIGFIFSVDEVNVAQATLRKMQWMDLASKVLTVGAIFPVGAAVSIIIPFCSLEACWFIA